MLRLFSAVVLLVCGSIAIADDQKPAALGAEERSRLDAEVQKLQREEISQYEAGKFSDALKLALAGRAILQRLYPNQDHVSVAVNLDSLGHLYKLTGDANRSLDSFLRSMSVNQRLYPLDRFPDGHPDLANSLNNLGVIYREMGQFARALPFAQQALAMNERLYPAEKHPDGHPDLARCLGSLAFLYKERGEFGRALPIAEKSLAMNERLYSEKTHPNGHAQLGLALSNLADLCRSMGRVRDAITYWERSLSMHERLYPPAQYPRGHLMLAANLTNLGNLYQEVGEYRKALANLERGLAMRKRLFPPEDYPLGHPELATALNNMGVFYREAGDFGRAITFYESALAMKRRIFSREQFPGGHPDLAATLNNLGHLLHLMGEHARALPFLEEAVAIAERIYPPDRFKEGHPNLMVSIGNLGQLLQSAGERGKALACYERVLGMAERLFPIARYPNGHPLLARSLSTVGSLLHDMKQDEKALPYLQRALTMRQQLFPAIRFKFGHPEIAQNLNILASVLHSLGRRDEALRRYQQTLEMRQQLFAPDRYPNGHPDLARSLNNLAQLHKDRNELDRAEQHFRQALVMTERVYPSRLYPEGHPEQIAYRANLASLLEMRDQHAEAAALLRDASRQASLRSAREVSGISESRALAQLLIDNGYHHAYLAISRRMPDLPVAEVYATIWPKKGILFDLLRRRHQAARTAATPESRAQWQRLLDIRNQQNLLAVRPIKDPALHQGRIVELAQEQERIERELANTLPDLERHRRLAEMGPAELSKRLPAGTVFLDMYLHGDWLRGKNMGTRYQVFVLARDREVQRVDLGPAEPIDQAMYEWRAEIESGRDGAAGRRLRDLVWSKIAAVLPAAPTQILIGADGNLTRLPWAALPGARPGTVLLEEFALAVVPNGKWLLEQLAFPASVPRERKPLVIGAIDYGAPAKNATRQYPALSGTELELRQISATLGRVDTLRGRDATVAATCHALADASIAHIATHGFYDSAAAMAEQDRMRHQPQMIEVGEGRPEPLGVRQHPLGYVGLVLAGVNDPAVTDGGILTGLGIVDLSLDHLQLVTLSACETGLGELKGGEGAFGLQRAFHLAGVPSVIASLWKVSDSATAALMTKFYHELTVNKKSPIDALRAAQLTILYHPELIPDLAGERGAPKLQQAISTAVPAPKAASASARASARLWAAFVLSGRGR